MDALVVSLGVDTYIGDPLGTFGLDTSDFASVGKRIESLGAPTTIVMEGGYAIDSIGANVSAFLAAF